MPIPVDLDLLIGWIGSFWLLKYEDSLLLDTLYVVVISILILLIGLIQVLILSAELDPKSK